MTLPQFTNAQPQAAAKPVAKGFNWKIAGLVVGIAGLGVIAATRGRTEAEAEAPAAPEPDEAEKVRQEIKAKKDPAAVALGKRGGRPKKKKPASEVQTEAE